MKKIMNLTKYNDMYNYSKRIKKINKNYELFYDSFNKLFIILNNANNGEICLKFNSFNLNIENILQKTSVKNSRILFKEIEETNNKLDNLKLKKVKNSLTDKCNELTMYSYRTNKILQSDINKILGVKNG